MNAEKATKKWFEAWEKGDFLNLPISSDFTHTSPYGTIESEEAYTQLVEVNKEKFLGHKFVIHDAIYDETRACVRYTAIKENFSLDVSEWYYLENGLIKEIVSYYNIEGEISEARRLDIPDS